MLRKVDELLNSITMYRLVLYYLILLWAAAFILSFFHQFPFTPVQLLVSTALILGVSWLTNTFIAKVLKVQTNIESVYITSLILSLIVLPSANISNLFLIGLTAFIAQFSKYLIAIRHKHIFNPASVSVFVMGVFFSRYASWWIGSATMLPFLLLGFLVIRKVRRFSMVLVFFAIIFVLFLFKSSDIFVIFPTILFFATVMLPEPLTTPATVNLQIIYAVIVGVLFSFQIRLETALIIGNLFSYIVSPKQRLTLSLVKTNKLTNDIYEFVFKSHQKLSFKAGQYLEWTLGQKKPDARGNRRFFTIASSPTEPEIKIAMKFPHEAQSTFKRQMLSMNPRHKIAASQLAGDFTLPTDITKKLVFIAGGIGITPFRSMIKYLTDINEKRDIVLMYSDKNINEFVYKNIFSEATQRFGLKVIYFETDVKGHMTADLIKSEIPDFKARTFYLSGPHAMVVSFQDGLSKLGINRLNIKVDYFSGY